MDGRRPSGIAMWEKLLLTARQVADALGISERKVWSMHTTARLPAPVQLGDRSTRWRRTDLERWIEAGCPSRERFAESAEGGRP